VWLLDATPEPEAHRTKLLPLQEPRAKTLPSQATLLSARHPANSTGDFFVSCRLRKSDSSVCLALKPLFHPSLVRFNGALSCYARVPPLPPAGAPKPLVTPLMVKIKRRVPVRCFNLWSPIMKPALQIGLPLIKSQSSHSRSAATIRWGQYPFRHLNLWRPSESRCLRIVPYSMAHGPAIVDSLHETVDLFHGFFKRKIIWLFHKIAGA
jgi:hypothetical protein